MEEGASSSRKVTNQTGMVECHVACQCRSGCLVNGTYGVVVVERAVRTFDCKCCDRKVDRKVGKVKAQKQGPRRRGRYRSITFFWVSKRISAQRDYGHSRRFKGWSLVDWVKTLVRMKKNIVSCRSRILI